MASPPDKTNLKKPTWTAQIVMLVLAALLLWLVGSGVLYLIRFFSTRL